MNDYSERILNVGDDREVEENSLGTRLLENKRIIVKLLGDIRIALRKMKYMKAAGLGRIAIEFLTKRRRGKGSGTMKRAMINIENQARDENLKKLTML